MSPVDNSVRFRYSVLGTVNVISLKEQEWHMTERVTLKDVAESLDVSIGTVARALHGKNDINAATRQRVLVAYKP